ncbi:MAG: hypothetical protein U9N76_05820 [Candidatus Marinimicrobia bacterium]|nr:hypothetical protein [Candidatus Neomarinimicrobiota bacterium]
MNNFNEAKNQYRKFQDEFSENIKDKFGSSIRIDGLEPIAQNLELLSMQENKIEIETLNIQRILLEARSLLPDLGA